MTSREPSVPAMTVTAPAPPRTPGPPAVPTIATDAFIGTDLRVPVADGRWRRYADLDQAATTPAFRSVRSTADRFLEWAGSAHRGTGFKSRLSTEAYEDARRIVAGFVGADDDARTVVFTRSATESLNIVAGVVDPGPDDVVAVSVLEHHANLLPWQRRCRIAWIEVDDTGRVRLDHLGEVLRRHAGRVRVVALSAASNVTGVITPIHAAAELAHAHGALISVDAAQLVAHRPLWMGAPTAADRLDFVSFSGHKMHAPYGAGVLVAPTGLLDRAAPHLIGGGAVRRVTRTSAALVEGPARHEAGSPNLVGAVAIAVAARGLQGIGWTVIHDHEARLAHRLRAGIEGIEGARLLGPSAEPADDLGGVVSLVVEGLAPDAVTSALGAEWAVGARDGAFCAHPYLDSLLGSTRGGDVVTPVDPGCGVPGAVRLSLSAASREDDVDRALDGLAAIARRDLGLRYAVAPRSGRVEPVGWEPPVRRVFDLTAVA